MFYAHDVLAKKGPLSVIWLAAHLEKKLGKRQICDTDLVHSINCIIFPQQAIALRLSGHLLLGVVRIFYRKVAYLHHDCSDALSRIKHAYRAPADGITPGSGGLLSAVDLDPASHTARLDAVTLREGHLGLGGGSGIGGVGNKSQNVYDQINQSSLSLFGDLLPSGGVRESESGPQVSGSATQDFSNGEPLRVNRAKAADKDAYLTTKEAITLKEDDEFLQFTQQGQHTNAFGNEGNLDMDEGLGPVEDDGRLDFDLEMEGEGEGGLEPEETPEVARAAHSGPADRETLMDLEAKGRKSSILNPGLDAPDIDMTPASGQKLGDLDPEVSRRLSLNTPQSNVGLEAAELDFPADDGDKDFGGDDGQGIHLDVDMELPALEEQMDAHESSQLKAIGSPSAMSKRRGKSKFNVVVDESMEISNKEVRMWLRTPPPKRSRAESALLPVKKLRRNYDLPLLADTMSSELLSLWKFRDTEAGAFETPMTAPGSGAHARLQRSKNQQLESNGAVARHDDDGAKAGDIFGAGLADHDDIEINPSPFGEAVDDDGAGAGLDTPLDRDADDADANILGEDGFGDVTGRPSIRDSLGSALWTEEDGNREGSIDGRTNAAVSLRSEKVEQALVNIFASNGKKIELRQLTEKRPKKLAARMVLEVLTLTTRSCLEVKQPVSYARIELTPTPRLGQ